MHDSCKTLAMTLSGCQLGVNASQRWIRSSQFVQSVSFSQNSCLSTCPNSHSSERRNRKVLELKSKTELRILIDIHTCFAVQHLRYQQIKLNKKWSSGYLVTCFNHKGVPFNFYHSTVLRVWKSWTRYPESRASLWEINMPSPNSDVIPVMRWYICVTGHNLNGWIFFNHAQSRFSKDQDKHVG